MKKIRAGIVGGAGYTGGELIRLMINHPQVEISFIDSKSNAGKYVHQVHNDLIGETDLQFGSYYNDASPADKTNDIDVLFLCAGHGEAKKFLDVHDVAAHIKIIDLSNDFRLTQNSKPKTRCFIYGLPELNKKEIRSAHNIANPGCFATAIQLGLLPLAKAGWLDEIYTTGITGSTGAGQALSTTSHFSWRANNVQSYKTLSHQHLNEIYQSLHQLQESFPVSPSTEKSKTLSFVPWRGDFTRGIFVSSTIHCEIPFDNIYQLYKEFYSEQPFTFVSEETIFLKQVVNTNKCVIQLEKVGAKLVIHSAIDNLLKGASGQALQNMNLMFGLEETTGLKLKANYF